MDKFAVVFPGQGSQAVGMLGPLNQVDPEVRRTFDEAGEVLGKDLWAVASEGPAEALNATEMTQPVMLAGGIAVWRCWRRAGGALPDAAAGHSLGEYTALVAAQSLDFADALRVVAERARLMQEAVRPGKGAMAAILGLQDEVVEAICREVSEGQVVSPANYNSPGQLVVAGDAAAVERATHACLEAGARRALKLPVSVPSHCALMAPAAERMRAVLADVEIRAPRFPVRHNVDAAERTAPEEIRTALVEQLSAPVRWTATVRAMVSDGVRVMAEAGPGRVLCGLGKRTERAVEWVALEEPGALAALASRLTQPGGH
ncbi:MAG: ACP S-malonyltransferase [Wenzhouxiangella sp.]